MSESTAFHPPEDTMVYPGLWECGQCHAITDTTHFYMDKATGEMDHCANPERRQQLADQCGWRWYDGYVKPYYRCSYSSGWHTEHRQDGAYPVRWTEDRWWGAIPPYDTEKANQANV